jgi:hypothetical protein
VNPTLPTKKQGFKWALGVIGAIFVGAIGSGVWQSLLGPALHGISRWLLDLASLGLASYTTNVYHAIAANNQSVVGIEVLNLVTIIYLFIICGLNAYYLVGNRENQRLWRNLSGEVNPEPTITADELKQKIMSGQRSGRILAMLIYFSYFFICVFVFTGMFNIVRLSYINSADVHYHQVLRVVSPYLGPHEQAQAESDFAQIASREDYVKVLSRLEKVAKDNGRTVPKFDPW